MEYQFTRKKIVFVVRMLVFAGILFSVISSPGREASVYAGYLFAAFYLFTNLVAAGIPERYFEDTRGFYLFVFFDTLIIAGGIYTAGVAGTDFYLVYFPVICLASLGGHMGWLMINTLFFTGVYGLLLYQGNYLSGQISAGHFMRLGFIPVFALCCGFVVTEALRARERRIQEAQERSRLLFEFSDVFVYTVGLSGEYLSANPKLYTAYGFEDEVSMLGLPFSGFHTPEETAEFQGYLDRVFAQGKPVQYESFDSRLSQWLSHTLSPILDQSGNMVFAVGVVSKDITERVKKEEELKQAYEKLRETRDQLIQKDKMAALGRLASGIAHEIRNPLEIISMGVDYLENSVLEKTPSAEKSVEKINTAVDRANAIIEDVLKFSRKSEFVIESVDTCALTEEVLSLAWHRIQSSGVKVFRHYPANEIKAAGNRNMLSQVLLNLVNNALDAMQEAEKKELVIKIYSWKVKEVGYKTGYRRADYFKMDEEMNVVEISDTGRGIAEDVLPKIFEPFFTTKAAKDGTGLGLSLSHMIMDRMMGTLDVCSRINSGTTFYVKLQPESGIKMIEEAEYDRV